ncbi:hypothetical protein PYW07_010276 [Mythimna separata]|uniref:Nucleolar protein 14 n=1 Tax=Mythimna separata TaxID=271217 RepID=A0AAD7YHT4_MYTSE|nr:hypothetical protein PYW07_010276 [Mythimna separata]
MAKVKNKRNSGLADKVHNKRKTGINSKKMNPFEVHINREKIKVLGKKSKHDRGLPGVSRAKAIQKRKETLGTEMKLMNKTNAFIDRRIGEKNNQLSAEDRMVARFAAERAKQHNKKNIYNLADDEILTHRGQTLEQIEKFDDPRSEDEDDEDGRKFGGLGDDFVAEGHFGGGMLSKTDAKDGAKSHKDLIEQLIAESKKRKAEKQKEKEQTLDLTEKLDSEWKDLQPVVFKKMRTEEKEPSAIEKLLSQAEKKNMDYDKMMRELKFEKRGTPSDGLKNDEKQKKEEQARLEQLEKEREMRMIGDDEKVAVKAKPAATKHRSAEDLDDNFELEDEHDFVLAYDKDGKPLVPENVLKDYSVPNAKPKFEDGISDTSDEDDEEDDEESEDEENDAESEGKSEEDTKKTKSQEKGKVKLVSNKKGDDSDSDDSDDSIKEPKTNKNGKIKLISNKNVYGSDSDESSDDDSDDVEPVLKTKPKEKPKPLEKANKVEEKKPAKKEKEEENTILFQNSKTEDSAEEEEESEEGSGESEEDEEEGKGNEIDLNDLNDLKQSDVESDEEEVPEDVEKIGAFFDLQAGEGDKLKELLSGKTPAQQSSALQNLIKSYDPSLAVNNKDKLSKLLHKDSKILNLEEDCSKMDVGSKMAARDLTLTEIDDDFKIRILSSTMGILKEFFDYFNDIEAQVYLFEPHLKLIGRIDLDMYPAKVVNRVNQVVKYMKAGLEVKTFTPLSREKKRPKALRLYEPDIQEVFTGSKSSKLSREQAESQRLKTKYKKEMKGALREIRRDKSYVGSVKIRQKIHSDNIRREKVKQIYKDASIQQGELNKMKRMK